MTPVLIALAGPRQGETFELGDEPWTLGRSSDNRLAIRQGAVSRRHCTLEPTRDGYRLTDLGSLRGTFVNSRAVTHEILHHGDLVQIGRSLFLFVEAAEGAPAETPPPSFDDASTRRTAVERDSAPASRSIAELPASLRLPGAVDALLGLTRATHAPLSPERLAEALLDHAQRALPAERGAVLLVGHDGEVEQAALVETVGALAVDLPRVRQALQDGAARIVEAAETSRALIAPLVIAERQIGALWLEGAELGSEHLELVRAAAAIVAGAIDGARRRAWLEAERTRLDRSQPRHLLGDGPAMRRVRELIARIAPTPSTVLVLGESGVGKELVARALHEQSPRAEGPFVAVNCAALSETLFESELFGHEKGAFTGAFERRPGRFEQAHGGTLMLDEVAEIPLALQAKLLRALQERQIDRVGGRRPIAVDVRLIAATHRDLRAEVEAGRFRSDLYYRLDVVSLTVPPLRERREDIPLLAVHFTRLHGQRLGRPAMALAPAAREALLAHDWPGNVRELANAIERGVVLAQDDLVRPEDLPESLFETTASPAAPGTYHESLTEMKRRLIIDALRSADGSVPTAAQNLGLSANYLHRLITNLGLRQALSEKR